MWNIVTKSSILCKKSVQLAFTRGRIRGKPPGVALTFEQKLEKLNYKDPALHCRVNIGLPSPPRTSKYELMQRAKFIRTRKTDRNWERASRTLSLNVNLDDVTEEWKKTSAPTHIYKIAEHYGIYDDLFGDAYFYPYVYLDIGFPQQGTEGLEAPVYRGNVVKPMEAKMQPNVWFEAECDSLWTLVLTNPDGHFTDENMEYVHWFVGNIPGNDIHKGEIIWDYLPPFPPRGLGFQRFIFVLYKQDKKIDYSSLKKQIPCLELKDRTFSTLQFYADRQDFITPAGLSFFQTDWDHSVIKIYHEILNMEEPIFEYDHVPVPVNKQKWFPKKKSFNQYLDLYRDPRDISKQYLLKKVEKLNPFEKPKGQFPYTNALKPELRKTLPSWLYVKTLKDNSNLGRIRDQEEDEYQ